jgi:hypothetical protein
MNEHGPLNAMMRFLALGIFEQDQGFPFDQNQPRAPSSLLLKTGRQ